MSEQNPPSQGGQGQPPWGGPPASSGPGSPGGTAGFPRFPDGEQPVTSTKGFFGALFDFSFEHFITPIIVKVVYVIALIVLVLVWLIWTVAALSQSAGLGVIVLLLGAVVVILYLAFIRMTLEF